MPDFVIDTLRGGFDDFTPISALPKDTCQIAENVEFFYSTMGERRLGTAVIDLPVGISGNANLDAVSWMFMHEPDNNPANAELWVMSVNTVASGAAARLFRFAPASGWTEITISDAVATTTGAAYKIAAQSLHGKLFICYDSAVDRLHVWDGATFRRVGLAAMGAPTAANNGGGAYAAVLRYYRTRTVKRSGTTVLVRSEPSASVSFTPSGAGAGVLVSRAALPGESETDWEVEVSLDNAVFYRIQTVAAATGSFLDTAVTTTYSANPQSDPIGTYTLVPSVCYLSADNDRLLLGGSFETAADGSAVRWTPTGTDPSPGPDERLNSSTDPRVDLDGLEGGDITGMTKAVSGTLFVGKFGHIYRLARTGNLVGAYDALCVTKARGMMPRSIVEACDEAGRPASYFLDPHVGPMRAGSSGLQFIGRSVSNTWKLFNKGATQPCHGVFHGDKQQVHWWIAKCGFSTVPLYPNCKLVLQTNEVRMDESGAAMRGWSTVPATGSGTDSPYSTSVADARSSCMFPQWTVSTSDPTQRLFPFIGKGVNPDLGTSVKTIALQQCDTGTTDNSVAYTARIRTKPFTLTSILNQHGVLAAALLGAATTPFTQTASAKVSGIRDYGAETVSVTASFDPPASERAVIAHLDNFGMSTLFALELEFGDDPNNITQWQLLQFAMTVTPEARSAE